MTGGNRDPGHSGRDVGARASRVERFRGAVLYDPPRGATNPTGGKGPRRRAGGDVNSDTVMTGAKGSTGGACRARKVRRRERNDARPSAQEAVRVWLV